MCKRPERNSKLDWAKSNAYFKYEQFLQTGNVAFLEDAKTLIDVQ